MTRHSVVAAGGAEPQVKAVSACTLIKNKRLVSSKNRKKRWEMG